MAAVPGYFKLVTLVGLWLFAKAAVDVAIMEVGCGGRHDATNVLGREFEGGEWRLGDVLAAGVSTLDLDHTQARARARGGV